MREEWLLSLSKNRLFDGISGEELRVLIDSFHPRIRVYQKHEYIAIAGYEMEGIGCLLEGEAKGVKEDILGNRTIVTLLQAGDIFGEMAAFSNQPQWPATIHAQQECTILFLPQQKLVGHSEHVSPSQQRLLHNMVKIMSEKALILSRKIDYLKMKSMRGRISTFLLEQWKKNKSQTLTLPMNRNELADFLGVSRPSMSREMGRMRDEGVIEFYRSSIRIIDMEALKLMAMVDL
jgi:CRP/FNR family transcriptional regulator, dissimilatory nitrate respiration regulator